jgi:hypothetical protein
VDLVNYCNDLGNSPRPGAGKNDIVQLNIGTVKDLQLLKNRNASTGRPA